jgi:hypothetical protein
MKQFRPREGRGGNKNGFKTEKENYYYSEWRATSRAGTERISLTKECGWKDGDRGGLAEWEQTHGKKKVKVCLDIDRPSHG